jgi:pSer/pThr/pTyr-binding forkhead associated (FHA) protein
MEVQLKVLVGNNVGQVLKVPGPKFFIGRAEDCHLRPGSDLVSRHHCVLMIDGTVVVVRDFGSKNGTLINGERIIGEAVLNNGDHLKVGPLEFEFQVIESLAGAKRPKVHSIKEAAVRTAESGVHSDLDIDALLGDVVDTGDTRELKRGDTAELEMGGSETTIIKPVPAAPAPPPPATAPEPEAASEPPPKQPGERKVIGKPAGLPKNPGDSKDAAAEMLRRLRRR